MKSRLILSLLALVASSCSRGPAVPPAPVTRVAEVKEILHGVEIRDPYRWLEDQKSPETRAWIDAQMKRTRAVLDALPGRGAIGRRLAELSRIESISRPLRRGGKYFYLRRAAGQERYAIAMREGASGAEKILVDPAQATTQENVSITLLDVSNDGSVVAYGLRQGGEDEMQVRFARSSSGETLSDELPKGRYFSLSMTADANHVYYSRMEENGPRIYVRAIGSSPGKDAPSGASMGKDARSGASMGKDAPSGASMGKDRLIFGEGYGRGKIIRADVSGDGRFLLIQSQEGAGGSVVEAFVQDLRQGSPIRPVIQGINARFACEIGGGTLFAWTNWEAPNGKVLAIDLARPARENWKEVIPEGKFPMDAMSLVGGAVSVRVLENVQPRLRIYDPAGKLLREVPLEGFGSVSGLSGEWEEKEAFYSFDSFHIPMTIYRLDVASGRSEVWFRSQAPVRSMDFEVRQEWCQSKDGARVPMFLLHKKGLARDGRNPVLLTGYGGFAVNSLPAFSTFALVFAERGGIYALANLRGGAEFGEAWHKAGMLANKQNTFDDFIAAAEHLIRQGYTSPAKLAIRGTSNGGLLVGAALTQRPELFRAVICRYPLLDMVRYHQFLVARFWIPEYGSSEDAQQFAVLHAYSPYHRVKKGGKYPSVLMVSGDADTRVDPLHGRKMTALLQAYNASSNPILLRYDTEAGHSSGATVSKMVEEQQDELAYLFWQLGMKAE